MYNTDERHSWPYNQHSLRMDPFWKSAATGSHHQRSGDRDENQFCLHHADLSLWVGSHSLGDPTGAGKTDALDWLYSAR